MRSLLILVGCTLALVATSVTADGVHASRKYDMQSIALAKSIMVTEAPSADDVADLKFEEFFETPAGRYGLEPTERLMSLAGQRVRMVGYIVGQDTPSPGRFVLAPFRLKLATAADGPADDLPPATVWVELPAGLEHSDLPPVLFPVLITGTLSVGPAGEDHGRVSFVRIAMDADDPRLQESQGRAAPAGSAVVAGANNVETNTETKKE